jgi:serine/threonine-protein kinase HipA
VTDLDITELGGVAVADVYKAGRLAAKLRRTPAGVEFSYLPDYAGSGAPPVATTLGFETSGSVTPAGAVPAFFAGLLPEGRRLSSLRRAVKTSADDELSLLMAVGRDPVGDVQIVPEGQRPALAEPLVRVERSFNEVSFSDLLADAGMVDPVAIPGVQEKVSARVISLPLGRSTDRWILKLDPPEYPNLVRNEAYFLALAKKARVPVAGAEVVHDVEGRPGLLVRRFDRVAAADGGPLALACEDACQLLGRWPADKYNVSSEQMVARVANVCAADAVARRDVFRQLVFAWLTGNGDVHAKNISVLRSPDGEWRVAPAYDLPSTVFYGDRSLALPLAGKRTGLSRRRLLEFALAVGLSEKAATRVLDQLLVGTAALCDELEAGALPFEGRVLADAVAELRFRRRQLSSR